MANDTEYFRALGAIKARIAAARQRAVLVANTQLIELYWQVGAIINARKAEDSRFIQSLARDIRLAFPGVTGYSPRNLQYMSQFAAAYPEGTAKQPVSQLPWGHNITLIRRVPDRTERAWYAAEAVSNGWSRAVLGIQLDTRLYRRQVAAAKTTNFEATLPRSRATWRSRPSRTPTSSTSSMLAGS